tara:strand:+ start:146 stop:352 length:207 start_codon:yes stop_codon:yes gene_type:complete
VSGNWSGSDYRDPEEVREFIEEHELEDELDEEPCLVLTQDEIISRIIDDCKRNGIKCTTIEEYISNRE